MSAARGLPALGEGQVRAIESALQEWRSALDAMPQLVFLHDAEGRILRANESYARRAGVGYEELLGKRYWEVFPRLAETPAPATTPYRELILEGGETYGVTEVPLALKDKSGPCRLLVMEKLGERRRTREALQKSEQRLKEAQRIAQLGSWELDLSSGVLSWSDEIYRIFELDPQSFGASYEAFLDSIHPEDRAIVDRAYRESVVSRKPYDIVHRLLTKDGRIKHVRERCETFYDQAGRATRSAGTVQDVTQAVLAEQAVARSEALLNEVQEVSGIGGWQYDVTAGQLYWTRQVFRIYELPLDYQLEGPDAAMAFYVEKDRRRLQAAFHAVVEKGEPYDLELQLVTAAGRRIWVRTAGRAELRHGIVVRIYGSIMEITEQKQTLERLRSARLYERRLAELVESSDDAILSITPQGEILTWNAAAVQLHGYRAEEIIGRPVRDLIPPDKAKEEDAIFLRVLRGERVQHYRTLRYNKAGKAIPVSLTVSPILDENGKVIAVSKIARDISELVSAEESLRQASFYARSLIEASLDPLVTISPEGKITDVNEATVAVTGLARDRLIGTDFSDYFTDPQRAREGYREVFATGAVTDYPLTIRHKEGRLVEVLYNASVYRDAEGRVRGVFAAARDITAQKAADEALAGERRRFNDVLDRLPVYVVLITPDYHVPYANRFFRERFGEARGRRCYEYLFGRSAPCEVCESFKPLTTGALSQWEWTGPDGRDYAIYDSPFTEADGSIRILEIGVDVTERKRAEAAIRELNASLEERVAQRTAALEAANQELARFNRAAVGRELRMVELKQQVNALCARLGDPPRYRISLAAEASPGAPHG